MCVVALVSMNQSLEVGGGCSVFVLNALTRPDTSHAGPVFGDAWVGVAEGCHDNYYRGKVACHSSCCRGKAAYHSYCIGPAADCHDCCIVAADHCCCVTGAMKNARGGGTLG